LYAQSVKHDPESLAVILRQRLLQVDGPIHGLWWGCLA
jgi:hypothetical protein